MKNGRKLFVIILDDSVVCYDVHTVCIDVRFEGNVVDDVLNTQLNFYCDSDEDRGAVGGVMK